MGIFEGLKIILQFLAAIPSILNLIKELQKTIDDMNAAKRERAEQERQDKMNQVAEKLKKSIEDGDEKGTDDALSSIVNDYKRRP